MKPDKKDITLEALVISAGLWLLKNPEKKVIDFDTEYLLNLKLNLDVALATARGSIH